MEYRFSKDPLFGKYCYIDTPWIAGKNTIYRIVNSGVRSNAWVEVPIRGQEEVVLHDYQEEVIFVVLDTLISENSTIKRVALKDVVVADTPQTERIKTHDYCDICNHNGCDNCIANNLDEYCVPSGYEPKDTPQTDDKDTNVLNKSQTDLSAEEFVEGMKNLKMEVKQTDCGWGEPNE